MDNFLFNSITVEQLKIFVDVAKTLSFTKTAENFNISLSSVSKKIATLEDIVGVQLFIRWHRSVQLTFAGKHLAAYCNEMLSGFSDEILRVSNNNYKGELQMTIAVCSSTYPYYIGAYFHALNPEINVEYVQVNYSEMIKMLKANTVDFAFFGRAGLEAFQTPPLITKEIAQFPLHIFVRKEDPLAQKKEVHLSELSEYRFLMLRESMSPWTEYITSLCKNAGFEPIIEGFYSSITNMCMNLTGTGKVFISDRNTVPEASYLGLSVVPIKGYNNSSNLIWNEEGAFACLADDMLNAAQTYWNAEMKIAVG